MNPLRRQFETASKFSHLHLETLTTEECLWRPAAKGLHVQRGDDGRWRADWPESEGYDIGPPSIAWLTWHIGFWWSMALDHSFGDGALERTHVFWPGDAEGVRTWIFGLEARWARAIEALSDEELNSNALTRWPFKDRPFVDVVAWANLELMKNAAEIGYARFLYATR